MTPRPWVVATTAPKRPLVEALPGWLAAWWTWSERGVAAWAIAVPTVAGWLLAGVALVVLAPVALVGWACRALVGGRGR